MSTDATESYECDACGAAASRADLSAGDDGRHRCPACAAAEAVASADARRSAFPRTARATRRSPAGDRARRARRSGAGGAAVLVAGSLAVIAAGAAAIYLKAPTAFSPADPGAADVAVIDAEPAPADSPAPPPAPETVASVGADLAARIESARRLLRDRQPLAARDALDDARQFAAEHAGLSPVFVDRAASLAASVEVLDRKLGRSAPATEPATPAPPPPAVAAAPAPAPAKTPVGATPAHGDPDDPVKRFDDEMSFFRSDTP